MDICKKEVKKMACGVEPFDKEWNVGYDGMRDDLSPYPRINKMRNKWFNTEFTVDHERACLVTEAYQKYADQPQIIKCANALALVLRNSTKHIYEDELIVGEIAAPMKSAPIFPEFSYDWIVDEINNDPWDQRDHDKYSLSDESKNHLLELEDYWKGKTIEENIFAAMSEDEKKGSNVGRGLFLLNLYYSGGVGHVIANYPKLFEKGYKGLKKQVEEKLAKLDTKLPEDIKKKEFYQAELIVLDATTDYINEYAKIAREKAEIEENEARKKELLQIAENCEWISENPPRSFWEALQLWYMATNIILIEANGHSVAYGRMDQYLNSFYEKDIEEGRITKEFVQELIEVAFVKTATPTKMRDKMTIIPNSGRTMAGECLTLGGVDENGKDATNDLTFMFLDASAHTRMMTPWPLVRLHANTPWELKVKYANIAKIGFGHPKLFNDEAAIPAVLSKGGRSLGMARDYAVVGCVEIDTPGYEYGWHDAIYFSIAKVLELAINNGKCLNCGSQCPRWSVCGGAGKQLGPQTGSLADFKSFDEVLEVYNKQLQYWIDLAIASTEIMDQAHQRLKPLPYLSLLIEDCIEAGVDISAGGARYNHTGPQAIGVGTVGDGLSAIKQLVFDENKVSGEDYLKALESNWEGYEALYALVNSDKVHHYGNDDDYADNLTKFGYDTYCDYFKGQLNSRGGTYQPGVYTASASIAFGLIQSASPDGRKASEPLSDNMGPVHTYGGAHDISGVTAIAKSASKMDHEKAGNGTLLNWKFSPSCVSGDTGRDNLISLVDTYFHMKGMHSQFNILNKETLEDALLHPENYKDLLVRVAGYSAYFIEINPVLQQDIINRSDLSFD